jgi:hypothetical protein
LITAYLVSLSAAAMNAGQRLRANWTAWRERPRTARTPRRRKQKREQVLIIDAAVDETGDPTSAYWFAMVPVAELLSYDRHARSRYRRRPRGARIAVYMVSPFVTVALTFAAIFFSAPDPTALWIAALLLSVMFGWMPGLAFAWMFVRFRLRTVILWVFQRVTRADASKLGLFAPAGESRYILSAVVPPPLRVSQAAPDTDGAIQKEVENMLWMRDILELGEDGWATENYLQGITGARARESELRGNGNRPTLAPPAPTDRGNPGARGIS